MSIEGVGVTVYAHVRAEATITTSGQCLILRDEEHPLAPTVYVAFDDLVTIQRVEAVLHALGESMALPVVGMA